jgi:hypothetical protein
LIFLNAGALMLGSPDLVAKAYSGSERWCSEPMASTSHAEVVMDLLLTGMLVGILLSATFVRR